MLNMKLKDSFPQITYLAQKAGKPVSIFDLETTGLLSSEELGITEIAVLSVFPNGEIKRFQTLVQPDYDVPPEVSAINGIDDALLIDQPNFPQVWENLQEIFEEHLIFGFNSNKFDVKVVDIQLERYLIKPLENLKSYDVRSWHQIATKMGPKGKLADVGTYWNVDIPEKLHRAAADVELTAGIMEALLAENGFTPLRDSRIKLNLEMPYPLPPIQRGMVQAPQSDIKKKSAPDILSWVSTEMSLNGYRPLSEWSARLGLDKKQLEDLIETAIDTKLLNAEDFAHEPTQVWLKNNQKLENTLKHIYPTEEDVGKLHFPFQALSSQLMRERPYNVIFDYVQLRVAMDRLNAPYVTRRGVLESFSQRDKRQVDTASLDLFDATEIKKPRPRFN